MQSFKDRLLSVCPELPKELVPKGYYRLNNVVVLRTRREWGRYSSVIGNCVLKVLNWAKAVILQVDTLGLYRKPVSKVIAGTLNIPVIHRELNTFFALDPLRITFSPGNHNERKLLLEEITSGVVVDMFACVGNLSLPLAKNNQVEVYGVEISPYTFDFLVKSIKLNSVQDLYHPILGDNRLFTPKNIADYVLMGFFDWDESQLQVALQALRNGVGTIYAHYLVPRGVDVVSEFKEKIMKFQVSIDNISYRLVKSFSPRKNHYVVISEISGF